MNKYTTLTPAVRAILEDKDTEEPFSGEYCDTETPGTYLCRGCGFALFRATHKFHSGCGWPSFDQEIPGKVTRLPDADGRRTEILCARCQGHLGHVFTGEQHTALNLRHCVNSLSLDFVADLTIEDTEEAILAAGCFWGVEYYLKRLPGVLKTEVGYTGGPTQNPNYQDVCSHQSGHIEALRVLYNPAVLSYESLVKYFFEIHDPTQTNGQGPDLGPQYLSAIFYNTPTQQHIAENIIHLLQSQGLTIATQLNPGAPFWPAETDHQDYYAKKADVPYCHRYIRRF